MKGEKRPGDRWCGPRDIHGESRGTRGLSAICAPAMYRKKMHHFRQRCITLNSCLSPPLCTCFPPLSCCGSCACGDHTNGCAVSNVAASMLLHQVYMTHLRVLSTDKAVTPSGSCGECAHALCTHSSRAPRIDAQEI